MLDGIDTLSRLDGWLGVVYDLEGDFRLAAEDLRERFAFYTDVVGLQTERKDGSR